MPALGRCAGRDGQPADAWLAYGLGLQNAWVPFAFLTGGLDTSPVAGLLARQRTDPNTYSIGFDEEGYDETGYAKLAAESFKSNLKIFYVTPADVMILMVHLERGQVL